MIPVVTHVSIVLLHYNTPEETHSCLESLHAIRPLGFKLSIVVVDNASRVDLVLSKSEIENGVIVVRSNSNLGFTGGNNLGIQYAIEKFNSDFICLLNSDTRVDSSFIKLLLAYLDLNPKVGAVCPLVFFEKNSEFHSNSYTKDQKGSVIWYGGGSIDWRNLHAFHKHVDEVSYEHVSDSTDEDFLTGCCVLLRREVLEKIQGFDDRFFLYLEDVDLSIRIRQAGYNLGMCTTAHIWHQNAGSSGGSGSDTQVYYQTRNRLLFFWTHGNWRNRLTVIRWALQLGMNGNTLERKALAHALLNNYGKETTF